MGIFDPKNKARKSKMKKDAIAELNSSNVNSTTNNTGGGASILDSGEEAATTFESTLMLHLLLPLTLITLIWGRKWFFTRVLLQLDKSCISLICPSISKRERLLRWTIGQLPYSASMLDVQLRHLWLDGSHLCTLINSAVPGACANPHRHWRKAPTHAQALAYKYLGIVPVFTDADFQTKTMTPNLEQIFQNYLSQLQAAISKISQEQEQIKRSHSIDYIARGMGLTTGEQHRKNFFYIYPIDLNHRYEDVIITLKGPYNTYGSVVLSSVNLLNSKNTSAPYKNSVGRKLYQQCQNLKRNDGAFLRNLSIDLTNITSAGINVKEKDTLDFDIKIEKGRAKIAFISNNNGIHELCVTTNGEHISGSPFNINIEKNTSGVLDTFTQDAAKRIYKTIKRKLIKNEIDFVTDKLVFANNFNFYDMSRSEESNTTSIDIPSNENQKKLTKQTNLDVDKEEELYQSDLVAEIVHVEKIKSADIKIETKPENVFNESIPIIMADLELLVEGEILAEDINKMEDLNCNKISEALHLPKEKQLLSEINEFFNCSSDLSNIELEELEDTELSEINSEESSNKFNIIPTNNNKVNSMVRKLSSKISSNHSIYCSSEFSTNSIELEELEDNDLSSDEFLYFGQNIFPEENSLAENLNESKSNISVRERIAYYNKSPKKIENSTKKVYTVNIPELLKCSTYEPDILSCHTVKYSEITTYASPIWTHIAQEDNPIQNITLLNTSSEIGNEINVLNTPTILTCNTNNKDDYSCNVYLEENNNSISNIHDVYKNNLEKYSHSYYNKSSEEFSEMFRQRKQFWDRKSTENCSGCSSDCSLSNPIISSYSFYNNRRLSSEKSIDNSNNFHRSLDCFQSQQYIKQRQFSDDDLCKSTDDLAFPSVKERKLLFINEMNNRWSKDKIFPLKEKYVSNQNLNIPDKVIEQHEVKNIDELPAKSYVMERIKIFDQDTNLKTKLKQPILQTHNKLNFSGPVDVIPLEPKRLKKSETILSNKVNFQTAHSYFKTLENRTKTISRTEFDINQIERRHSVDYENKVKIWESEINGGSFTLPRVSEKFPLDNIYKDVLGDRKSISHLKGSANKVGMIVTLHSMSNQTRELNIESEFKEELFFGQKKFKDRPQLNSIFSIHY